MYKEKKIKEWLEQPSTAEKELKSFVQKKIIIEIDGKKWIKRHLEKSDHNLDFATLINGLHQNIIKEKFPKRTFYDWVAISYYYAVYHAALALLANLDYKSKSHLATLCGIIVHYYHKTKLLEKEHIEILGKISKANVEQFRETQSLRERASYGTSTNFEKSLANLAKEDSINFVNKIKEILE
ncbi:MAG: HEPN domain-containing protein [Nanoarchaeota archaeon]|nr:HEPN domain-containing protein [Nanoarchaeota archaeon]